MSIRPDRWIKRMALEHRMIEPFVESQMRTGVVSYGGTSSRSAWEDDLCPLRLISANEGIAQVLFFQSDEMCEVSYRDKKRKYQAQQGVTLPEI